MRIVTSSSTIAVSLALIAAGTVPALGQPSLSTPPAQFAGATSAAPEADPAIPMLVAIRASHRQGRDRVVFEFKGALPERRSVRYVDRLIADGSGLPMPIAGRAILEATFSPANAHNDAGKPTAPVTAAFALPNVMHVVSSGDFEAVTTYGIGLASKQPVRVSTMTNPSRVVIDIGAGFPTTDRKVWMLSSKNFAGGRKPYFVSVRRPLLPTAPATAALDRIFAGPTAAEQHTGLKTVLSGATGFRNLRIAKGIARIQLTGGCTSKGSTATIAGQITPTLKQFSTVKWVKIYDPAGRTERPNGKSDSIPECLEP